MENTMNRFRLFSVLVIFAALLSFVYVPPASAGDAERIARLAMSTASLWMVENHLHEVAEDMEKGDMKHAKHETEELIPWLKGTAWAKEVEGTAMHTVMAAEVFVKAVDSGDKGKRDDAFEALKKAYHHLHHGLMEVVGSGHGDHGKKKMKH